MEMCNKMFRCVVGLLLLVCVRCDTIDVLVEEEKNCTRGIKLMDGFDSMEGIKYCREYAMQRLTLYIAAQQLYVARHREERESMVGMKIQTEELRKEREKENNAVKSNQLFGIFFLCWVICWPALGIYQHFHPRA